MADITPSAKQHAQYYARTASGSPPKFYNLQPPHSNFDFIDNEFGGLSSLRRVMSQVRQHKGRTMAWEEIQTSEDLKQENEDILLRYHNFKPLRTIRLSFYTKSFLTLKGLVSAKDSFLGYVIIRQIANPKITWIFESVLKPSREINNFIRGEQEWTCVIGNFKFRIKGYLYAQQNGISNVCAHVALRTAACRFRQGDMTYREMNDIIGVDHRNRIVGKGKGLSTRDMIKVLDAAGAYCMVRDYTVPKKKDYKLPFQKILYGSIESGFPAIVVFQMANEPIVCHAIPVFGHTFNEDAWVHRAESDYFKVGPSTRYISSESWVSMYIAHDDNWGSNFCVPRNYLHTRRYCKKRNKGCIMDSGCVRYVIGTFPKEVRVNALQAEVIGADYLLTILKSKKLLTHQHAWGQRLRSYFRKKQIVLRPILVKKKEYIEHLNKIGDWERRKLGFQLQIRDDEWIWIVELSIPELFSANRRKVGEVILRAEHKPLYHRDFENFLIARIPGYFAIYVSGGAKNPSYEFRPCGLKSHVELYGCEDNR